MKISLKWLNDYVDVTDYASAPQGLADILTRAGLEVEDIQNRAKDFTNVVIGKIITKDKHPNADKLSLCQVAIGKDGKDQTTQIVCGAQNHKAGDFVIAALPGAVLPGNFAIKKSKIRDVESNGMLCSYKELGLADSSEGIAILDNTSNIGQSFAEFGGFDDVLFELKVTPNRADCLSHFGLARELSCLLNKPLKSPEVAVSFSKNSTKEKISLKVLNENLCTRYSGRYIADVKIGPSPNWLKQRLEAIGLTSINNVVDVTNYVMHEMGQPLHAFDADLIAKNQIVVREADTAEKFKTLKEQELKLKGGELLICDGEKPVALAGVIGGMNSGVSDKTRNIFIESATFSPMSVRKSSRTHGVETDSAYRFARGVDPTATVEILNRAALLVQIVAGGEVFGDHHDYFPAPIKRKSIELSIKTISERLGYEADETLFLKYMKGLQIDFQKSESGAYRLAPPLFRFDLEQDMDLVEEYARLNGYENIQERLPALHVEPGQHDLKYTMNQKISGIMRGQGVHQAFNYAFTSRGAEQEWIGDSLNFRSLGFDVGAESVEVVNPLSEDLNAMKRTLSWGLWQNTLSNIRAGNEVGSLFELGSIFNKNQEGYIESRNLAVAIWGEAIELHSSRGPKVFELRSILEKMLLSLQITAFSFAKSNKRVPFLHHGQWGEIVVQGETVGYIGTVHPKILGDEKVRVPVAIAEINLEAILRGQPRPLKFKSVNRSQIVSRDFAFVMNSDRAVGDLIRDAKKSCGSLLRELIVFDVYEGDKLPAGQKSVGLRATFQSTADVVSEEELTKLSAKLVEAAQKSVAAVLR